MRADISSVGVRSARIWLRSTIPHE